MVLLCYYVAKESKNVRQSEVLIEWKKLLNNTGVMSVYRWFAFCFSQGRKRGECYENVCFTLFCFLHSNPPLRKMRRYFAELAHKCANLSVRKAEFYRAFLTKTLPQLVCGTPVTLPTCGRRLYYKRGQAHCWYSKLADEKLDYERLICRI